MSWLGFSLVRSSASLMALDGGEVDLALYAGEGGGFIRDPASKAAPLAMQRILDFVHARLG